MPLSAADLDRIEALAKGATPGKRTVEYWEEDAGVDGVYTADGDTIVSDTQNIEPNDAELLAALDPDTVLALVEAARRGMACK